MSHPSSDSAYGIWSLNEVRDAVRGGNWPVPYDFATDADPFGDSTNVATFNFNNTDDDLNGTYTVTGNEGFVTGIEGNAASNTGTNTLGIPVSFNPSGTRYTISFWTKRSASFATNSGHVMAITGGSESGVYHDTSGQLGWWINNGVGQNLGFFTMSLDTWYHVVWVVGNSAVRVYVNGTNYINTSTGTYNNSNHTFRVGRPGYSNDWHIDMVRIFNRELTSGEVTTLYNEAL